MFSFLYLLKTTCCESVLFGEVILNSIEEASLFSGFISSYWVSHDSKIKGFLSITVVFGELSSEVPCKFQGW